MPETNLKADALRAQVTAEVERTLQSRRLGAYPLLVFAPLQETHAPGADVGSAAGPALRTEDRGVAVSDIAAAAGETPDPEALAERFGTTAAHVRQALAYRAEHGPDA